MELVNNANLILTKNAILQKARLLLLAIQEKQQEYLYSFSGHLPPEVLTLPAKISRGENYQGLPYLILDYPRYFDKQNVFAIRTMFWWGNFFSITLHLSGTFKKMFAGELVASYQQLKETGFFICVGQEEWEHHFEKNNYVQLSELDKIDFENCIRESSFFKLSQKIPLAQWDDAREILSGYFKQIIELLAD